MPGGILKFAGTPPAIADGPPGVGGARLGTGPVEVPVCCCCWSGIPDCVRPTGGCPVLPRWKAFILAAISGLSDPPLPNVLGGGLLAALTFPSGVDDEVIPAVVAEADMERGDSGGGARRVWFDCSGDDEASG